MNIIRISEKDLPGRLKLLSYPPKKLNACGDLDKLLKMPSLGIVGARKASSYGRSVTDSMAEEAAGAGICIVSGLALGVDSIAHKAALNAKGRTIAVLPSGLKQIYPASHREQARSIIEKDGVLVSEFEDDFRPRKESFIQRNRIIAALSDVLLVTEAAERSGSLHTANFALELGKTVLAVPGNITSPYSTGTNNLIKSGAVPVTSTQDIFDVMGIKPGRQKQLELYGDNQEEAAILKLLGTGLSDADEIFNSLDLDVQVFQQTLTMMELKGIIAPVGNNHWRVK
jgi:DNA processing protein